MSLAWRNYCIEHDYDPKNKDIMREWFKERHATRKNEDGTNRYITEQSGKDQCDINVIIAKYPQRVIASKMAKDELTFADISGIDYTQSLNLIKSTESTFMKLPPEIRAEFKNDVSKYLDYLAAEGKAADGIDQYYKEPKWKKSKEAISMKDENKDGVPDKLQSSEKGN